MALRVVSWNVLADEYLSKGNYGRVEENVFDPRSRHSRIAQIVKQRHALVIALQEVNEPLYETFVRELDNYQVFWTQKTEDKPDGCALLVRSDLPVRGFQAINFSDGTGHVAQVATIKGKTFVNTHLKWAPIDSEYHAGVEQMRYLLMMLLPIEHVVLMMDSNDRPGGPIHALLRESGFENPFGNLPTARVDDTAVSLDLIAVRGLKAEVVPTRFDPRTIPSRQCPSYHIPIAANIGRKRP